MEEEKAAAYYDDLSRKGGGAARFKQGLGFSAGASSNDAVPSRGSAIPSTSSFLSSFVRASSPSKNEELERKSQLQSIQNKLKKKNSKEVEKSVSSSRVSKDRDDDKSSYRHSRDILAHERESRSREKHSKHRSRSRSKDRVTDRYSRHRSRSRSSNRRHRSRSTSSDRGREWRRRRRRSRSSSDENRDKRKKNRDGKGRNSGVDYASVIEGYDRMTPAERVKAKMKLQLSETAEKDEAKGMGAGWERFDFNKDASLDNDEIEAAEDDVALVKQIGQTFRFSAMEARREEQIKAAHDEAIFGSSCHPPQNNTDFGTSSHEPVTVEEMETKNIETNTPQTDDLLTNLISNQVMAMQQVSWRDRTRRS